MKLHKSIWLLLIAALFLSGTVKENRKSKLAKTFEKVTGINKNSNGNNLSIYEVQFTYTGYVSFYGDSRDCPVGSGGKVILTGRLRGNENVTRDEDVSYDGTLQMNINIAICSAKGEGDNAKLCSITVTGSGPVVTWLEIQFDGRGGYIQIKDTTSTGFTKNVGGTCDTEQTDEERKMVPLKSISSVFNGLELPVLAVVRTLGELQVNKEYEDQMETGKVVIKVLRKIQ